MHNKVIFSALVHDIGKLIMRAEDFRKNHSDTGVEYLSRYNNVLLKDETVLDTIKFHHAKQLVQANLKNSHIAYIVYEADNISSGTDRRPDLDKDIELKTKYEKFDKTLCLSSVFNNIDSKTEYVYRLKDLEDKSPNYPENNSDLIAPKDKYQKLEQRINENIESIKNPNSLLQLLEATTSFVPSSTDITEVSDISLYDHSKLTAAIASCMYEYFKENNIDNYKERCFDNNKAYRGENYYRLVSFDISGIQDFIYTIASKDALKSLRARSFYLEFLMEHIQDELLEALNLSRANILYSGGGHSYLLLPNTQKTSDTLNKLQTAVNDWFIEKFATELYLASADVECSSDDLINSIPKFKELSKKLSKSKLQRYTNEQLKKLFTIDNTLDDTRECAICKKSGNLDSENKCEFCQSLIELGVHLVKDKNFVIIVSDEKKEYSIELPTLSGNKKYFKVEEDKKGLKAEDDNRYYAINNYSTANCNYFATNIWMGDYCSRKENNDAYAFEDFAKESGGINRLGVLRADVDDLGTTFTKGFGNVSTISRYATLSRMLNMFYKHYINDLCKDKKLAVVYSGGDDVFVVGAWNDVLKFAKELRDSFRKYTCEKLHLSAGVGFFTQSYPISKMAELTGVLEDFAKKNNNNKKDSIALFGENKTKNANATQFVFTWSEFDEILQIQKDIEDKCYFDEKDKKADKVFFSTALIYRMMVLLNSTEEINLARFAYTLARMESNSPNYSELKEKLYRLYDSENKKKLLTALYLIIYKNRK